MNNSAFDSSVIFLIMVAVAIYDSFLVLLSISKKGFMVNPRTVLEGKSVKELKVMLKGKKGISKLNKDGLVDLVLSHA